MCTKILSLVFLVLTACQPDPSPVFFTGGSYTLVKLGAEKEDQSSGGFLMIAGFGGGGYNTDREEWVYFRYSKSDGAIFSAKFPLTKAGYIGDPSGRAGGAFHNSGYYGRAVIIEDAQEPSVYLRFCSSSQEGCGPDKNEFARMEFHVPAGSVIRKIEGL